MNQTVYLKVREAAALLEVSTNTIRVWGASGKLREFRHPVNNYRIFLKDAIEDLRDQIPTPKLTERLAGKPQ